MLAPCEVAVKSVIPAIRAYVAKELTEAYDMKQTDVALILGITQTAVSKYLNNVRGQAIKIDHAKEIQNKMNEIASKIVEGKVSGPQLMLEFCDVCKAVRRTGLMCQLCERSDLTQSNTPCTICKKE